MRGAVARHDELVHALIAEHAGVVFSTMGDGVAAAFGSGSSAVAAALDLQRRFGGEVWPTARPLRVRVGLHTGEAEERGGDYFGTAVNRAARLMAIGHGGQVLCSEATAALLDRGDLVDLGEHRLRDLDRPLRVFQVGHGRFPPLRSVDAVPTNLPIVRTELIGRSDDVTRLSGTVEANALVTFTGTGGVGKTRLALAVAAHLAPRFPDGSWLAGC
jgi:hypothetical protein